MPRKFPRLRPDGSFSIVAVYRFNGDREAIAESVATWIHDWLRRKDPWIRRWSTGETETLIFSHEFSEAPRLVNAGNETIQIEFEGRPGSRWWKDWIGRFTHDLVEEHPGIASFDSCVDGTDSPNRS
ncbi:MAG: hypothetical protein KDA60_22460 [Planctomycetales bacterium]|nr:hypothetical protein [Planctomycetales bacterium]